MHPIPTIKTILYATALNTHTRPVFRHALGLAQQYQARIILLHVIEPLSASARVLIETHISPEAAVQMQQHDMQRIAETIKMRLQKFCVEEMDSSVANMTAIQELLVVAGDPSEEILRVADAQSVDAIVMGKSSGSLFGGMVMGSVARRVTRNAKVPVLVVPNFEKALF